MGIGKKIFGNMSSPIITGENYMYGIDVDEKRSSAPNFIGDDVPGLFLDQYKPMVNNTSDNPKFIYLEFRRPFQTNEFGFTTSEGNFSNVKVVAYFGLGPNKIPIPILDESSDNTKKTLLVIIIAETDTIPSPLTFSSVRIEFHTSDPVTISGAAISKVTQRLVRIQATRPDGLVGNAKCDRDNNIIVTDASSGFNIARGNVPGISLSGGFDLLLVNN